MLARRDGAAIERPFNNLLRRLNEADFTLIAPHLTEADGNPNDLLYNPGDNVDVVHFPCGPSLASYLVPSEDGRDVETVLIGREGAVGGIVSQGFLPAYTRIMVKFAGPFVRMPVGKLNRCALGGFPCSSKHGCKRYSKGQPQCNGWHSDVQTPVRAPVRARGTA